jgi:signal transduction histidine kinase
MENTQLTPVNVPATQPLLPLPRKGPGPTLREQGGDALALAGIVHDARNLVTALGLCAEMISEPGALSPRHGHYAAEIQSIVKTSTQLVQRLSDLCRVAAETQEKRAAAAETAEEPVTDLADAVQRMGGLLTAVAGPVTQVQIACLPCRGELRLSEESLSRILTNLVRNAADAMPTGGRVRITAQQGGGGSFLWTLNDDASGEPPASYLWDDAPHAATQPPQTVVLTVEDDGPGIPTEFLERVFERGFSTRKTGRRWPENPHQGLGLNIVRQLVEAAGGTVHAAGAPGRGARFEIELPLTNVTPCLRSERVQNGPNPLQ